MISEYKSQATENKKKVEHVDIDTKEEYIVENVQYYKDLLFSESNDDVMCSLKWFCDALKDVEYIVDDSVLVRLMELLKENSNEMKEDVLEVIKHLTKFQSSMQNKLFENGLLDYMLSNYERKLNVLFINCSSTNPDLRLKLIKNKYIEIIEDEFERGDANVADLAKMCRSLVCDELDFMECNGPKIFELFQKLLGFLKDDENAKQIISAFLHMLTSNDNFIFGFLQMEMLKLFVELETNDEEYLIGLFDLLNIICNSSEEASKYLLEYQIVEFSRFFLTDDYSDLLMTKVIILLTNLIFYFPQSIEIIQDNRITVDILDMYYEDDNKSAGFIKALVNYCVIAMGFSSSIYYNQLNDQGCYTIIVENISLIEPIYYRFTLNVILRGFPNGKPEIKEKLKEFLKENDEFIKWLEFMRSEDNINIKKLAIEILNLIYPENPVQIM